MPHGRPLWNMPRRRPGTVPYGQAIFTCANVGQIALAFDDGPSNWTRHIIEELDKHNVKATFFIMGNNQGSDQRIDDESSEWPALLREMHYKGHQLASHTWTHKHLEQIGRDGLLEEMVYNEMAFRNVLGLVPTYMRPPYGEWRDDAVRARLDELGYHIVMYNVDTKDYEHNGPDAIQASVDIFDDAVAPAANGSYLVLAHDIHEWTALKLLPAMLRTIQLRGYEAVTVGECLNDEWTNWYRDPASEDW
ncbi:carbohydrate esterase family 4 protein [Hypoxylon sp. FL1857]|nr:carbohydrate esterase family 4 protein [Hypoxylon sp. FL1857]